LLTINLRLDKTIGFVAAGAGKPDFLNPARNFFHDVNPS